MKLKHRALTLLLSVAMLLTFMPTMAFATDDDDEDWYVTNDYSQQYLKTGDSTTLKVNVDNPKQIGLNYQWYSGDYGDFDYYFSEAPLDEYDSIEGKKVGANADSLTVSDKGDYFCLVTPSGEHAVDDFDCALFSVKDHWFVDNDGSDYYLGDKDSVTIEVHTNFEEIYHYSPSNVSYQWYKSVWHDTESGGEWQDDEITGATRSSYNATEEATFTCRVTIGAITEEGSYNVYEGDPDEDEEEDPDDPDDEYFDYQSVYINSLCYELNTKDEADQAGVWYYDENNKPSGSLTILDKVTLKNGKTYTVTELQSLYDLPGVTSITIPATVTLIEEQSIGFYGGYIDADEEEKVGKKVANFTIFGKTGSEAQRYANANGFAFRDLEAERAAAEAARRQQEEYARQQAAIAAAEAARQGTPGALPKLKASKPSAAKKAITVKWKKLNKKQLKQGASNIEVWVCTNGAFASGSTIEKVVGKKKSSVKIKGLQKGVTYFAKVRTIKYSGGTKVVGPWSATKKVKVKK